MMCEWLRRLRFKKIAGTVIYRGERPWQFVDRPATQVLVKDEDGRFYRVRIADDNGLVREGDYVEIYFSRLHRPPGHNERIWRLADRYYVVKSTE